MRWIGEWARLGWRRFRDLLGTVRRDRVLWPSFVLLLSVDLAFSLLYATLSLLWDLEIHRELWDRLAFLRIDFEGGLPEWINYGQTLLLVLLLGRLFLVSRRLVYFSLAMLFAVVLADDSLALHERGGAWFVRHLNLHALGDLRAQDVGEQLTWMVLGLLIGPLVVLGIARARRPHLDNGLALLIPFGGLVFFGMVVDQLYPVLRHAFFGADTVLGTAEDGGEMLSLTVACALAAALVRHGPLGDSVE